LTSEHQQFFISPVFFALSLEQPLQGLKAVACTQSTTEKKNKPRKPRGPNQTAARRPRGMLYLIGKFVAFRQPHAERNG